MADKPVVATVTKVVKRKGYKSYVVTKADGVEGSITFSLQAEVWHEKDNPTAGAKVVLSDIRNQRGGWRAFHGRFYRPSDEQPQK